ncbi:MAG: hypothetical protein KA444_04530 [Bacteroidia bacterium]|nr:hypothetical protein [Bacteroidia bacterium]
MKQQFMIVSGIDIQKMQNSSAEVGEQKRLVQLLMNKGILLEYSISADFEKVWMVMEAESEINVIQILSDFPLLSKLHIEIIPLKVHRSHTSRLYQPSLN